MCDELKLKNDIYWNCKNNKMVGFVSNTKYVDVRDDIRSLLKLTGDIKNSNNNKKQCDESSEMDEEL